MSPLCKDVKGQKGVGTDPFLPPSVPRGRNPTLVLAAIEMPSAQRTSCRSYARKCHIIMRPDNEPSPSVGGISSFLRFMEWPMQPFFRSVHFEWTAKEARGARFREETRKRNTRGPVARESSGARNERDSFSSRSAKARERLRGKCGVKGGKSRGFRRD